MSGYNMNLKAAIFASIGALPSEKVAVPEFGEGVELFIAVMSGAQREAFENNWRELSGKNKSLVNMGFGVCLLTHCVVDEQHNPVFSPSDFDELMKVNSVVLGRLIKVALKVNHILNESIEDVEKNS